MAYGFDPTSYGVQLSYSQRTVMGVSLSQLINTILVVIFSMEPRPTAFRPLNCHAEDSTSPFYKINLDTHPGLDVRDM